MRANAIVLILLLAALPLAAAGPEGGAEKAPSPVPPTPQPFEVLHAHLKAHFDDIHDVSMRFHHLDHRIGGLVAFEMIWEKGRLQSTKVVENETKREDLAQALIAKMKAWHVPGLTGPSTIVLPLRITLVGSKEPAFPKSAILTGKVLDEQGLPVPDARIRFSSADGRLSSVPEARTNREGIFVRTLIPAGRWHLRCEKDGYVKVWIKDQELRPGEHARQSFLLVKPK